MKNAATHVHWLGSGGITTYEGELVEGRVLYWQGKLTAVKLRLGRWAKVVCSFQIVNDAIAQSRIAPLKRSDILSNRIVNF